MAIKNARKKLGSAAGDARSAIKPATESAMDKIGSATDLIGSATSDAISATQDAITAVAESVGPAIEDARDKLAPYVEEAKDRISPVVDSARDKIGPTAGVAVAAGRRRGRKAAVALRLADEPKPSHKLRNLVILLGLGGAAAFLYTKLSGKDADPAWTAGRDRAAAPTTAEPAPAPTPATEPEPEPVSDSSVDNSDVAPTAPFPTEETAESDLPTTPDEPLEEKSV